MYCIYCGLRKKDKTIWSGRFNETTGQKTFVRYSYCENPKCKREGCCQTGGHKFALLGLGKCKKCGTPAWGWLDDGF